MRLFLALALAAACGRSGSGKSGDDARAVAVPPSTAGEGSNLARARVHKVELGQFVRVEGESAVVASGVIDTEGLCGEWVAGTCVGNIYKHGLRVIGAWKVSSLEFRKTEESRFRFDEEHGLRLQWSESGAFAYAQCSDDGSVLWTMQVGPSKCGDQPNCFVGTEADARAKDCPPDKWRPEDDDALPLLWPEGLLPPWQAGPGQR